MCAKLFAYRSKGNSIDTMFKLPWLPIKAKITLKHMTVVFIIVLCVFVTYKGLFLFIDMLVNINTVNSTIPGHLQKNICFSLMIFQQYFYIFIVQTYIRNYAQFNLIQFNALFPPIKKILNKLFTTCREQSIHKSNTIKSINHAIWINMPHVICGVM